MATTLARRVARRFEERRRMRWHEWIPRRVGREGLVLAQHVREGRFQRSLSFITAASAVLAGVEVTYEHYRGSYGNKMMYTPVVLTPPLIAAGLWAVFDRRATRHVLPAVAAASAADGLLGTYFHVRGIRRKPGGWRIPVFNLVMGPPVLAPLLFAVPGYLGVIASFLRREDDPRGRFRPLRTRMSWRRQLREGRFQKHLAVSTAISAVASGFEALYSHYKNNFKFKAQWTPVIVAPMLAGASVAAVFHRKAAHSWLPAMSVLATVNGLVGFGYHLRGLLRRPGGVQYLGYNLVYGPPIFAPLLFSASGFLGLLASLMRRER